MSYNGVKMVQAILLISMLSSGSATGPVSKFALTESTRSVTTKTVIQQMSSTMSEESTSFQSQWKFEASVPFTADQWAMLAQVGTFSVKVGKQLIEENFSANDGFNPKNNSFKFKLTKPVVADSGYKYITLPTDKPATPAPAPGTKFIYGQGSIEFKGGTLKISLSTIGKSGMALVGENFVAVVDGNFEGKLPIEVTAGTQHLESEFNITGTAKHRDSLKDEPMGTTTVGRTVQLSLTGKS